MSAIPATTVPRRAARPVVSGVPGLKLVPAPASARGFFGVVIVCALLLVGALGTAFALNTQMVDTAYEIQSVQKELNVATAKEATLADRVVSASTPQKLTAKAEQLGLLPATSVLHLDLTTGAVKKPSEPQRK